MGSLLKGISEASYKQQQKLQFWRVADVHGQTCQNYLIVLTSSTYCVNILPNFYEEKQTNATTTQAANITLIWKSFYQCKFEVNSCFLTEVQFQDFFGNLWRIRAIGINADHSLICKVQQFVLKRMFVCFFIVQQQYKLKKPQAFQVSEIRLVLQLVLKLVCLLSVENTRSRSKRRKHFQMYILTNNLHFQNLNFKNEMNFSSKHLFPFFPPWWLNTRQINLWQFLVAIINISLMNIQLYVSCWQKRRNKIIAIASPTKFSQVYNF